MRGLLKFVLTFIIGLVILLVLLQRVGWARLEEALALFFTWQGAVIVVLIFCFAFVSALRWRLILKRQGNDVPFSRVLKLWLAGTALSYFTPIALLGGEAARVIGLRKIKDSSKKDFSWRESIVSVGADKIFDGTVFLFFLLAGLITFALIADFTSKLTTAVTWFCVAVLGFAVFLFYFKRKEGPAKWFLTKILGLKQIEESKNGKAIFEIEKEVGRFFSLKKAIFWKCIGLSFLKYGIGFLRIIFLFYFVSGDLHFFRALAVYGFYNLSLFFPMPAALGSLEAAGAVAFGSLGYGLSKGIVFALLCRGADLILAGVGLIFLIKLGFSLLGEKILKWIGYFSKDENELPRPRRDGVSLRPSPTEVGYGRRRSGKFFRRLHPRRRSVGVLSPPK